MDHLLERGAPWQYAPTTTPKDSHRSRITQLPLRFNPFRHISLHNNRHNSRPPPAHIVFRYLLLCVSPHLWLLICAIPPAIAHRPPVAATSPLQTATNALAAAGWSQMPHITSFREAVIVLSGSHRAPVLSHPPSESTKSAMIQYRTTLWSVAQPPPGRLLPATAAAAAVRI